MEAGQQLTVVTKAEEDDPPQVILEGMASVLEKVGNRKLVVHAVTGKMRKGKSFFLTCCLNYLMSGGSDDWIETMLANPEQTFTWRRDQAAVTGGVNVWSEPLIVRGEGGEEVAVLLLDCQGCFDSATSTSYEARMFAFCILLSSVLGYNVQAGITENDIQPFSIFLDTALAARESSDNSGRNDEAGGTKPLQTLVIINRDTDAFLDPEDLGYHTEGSCPPFSRSNYFRDTFYPPEIHEENMHSRALILSTFAEVGVHALPHPGLQLTNSNANDCSNLNPLFITHATELMKKLFSPDSLVTKCLGDIPMTGEQYLVYFRNLAEVFNNIELPDVKNMFQAMADNQHLLNKDSVLQSFRTRMDTALAEHLTGMPDEALTTIHDREHAEALARFLRPRLIGGDEYLQRYQAILLEELEQARLGYKAINDERVEAEARRQLAIRQARDQLNDARAHLERCQAREASINSSNSAYYKQETHTETRRGGGFLGTGLFAGSDTNTTVTNVFMADKFNKDKSHAQGEVQNAINAVNTADARLHALLTREVRTGIFGFRN